jgi:MSHA pilin protein MshC
MIWSGRQKPYHSGFTMLELITVIAIVGVLSVAMMPASSNISGNVFNARGFHHETLALLRFGQKSAIAQRRTVCVVFSDASVKLRIATSSVTPTCSIDLQGPKGGSTPSATITAKSRVSYSTRPQDFNFNGLGQPVDGSAALVVTQVIQVGNAFNSITVEATTGYIHE